MYVGGDFFTEREDQRLKLLVNESIIPNGINAMGQYHEFRYVCGKRNVWFIILILSDSAIGTIDYLIGGLAPETRKNTVGRNDFSPL